MVPNLAHVWSFVLGGVSFAATNPTSVGNADAHRYVDDIKTLTQARDGRSRRRHEGIDPCGTFLRDRYKGYGLEPAGKQGTCKPFTVTTGAKLHGKNVCC